MKTSILALLGLLLLSLSACDSDTAGEGPGSALGRTTLTLGAENGVDFSTHAKVDKANFANSDLFATDNGDALKLATGSDKPTTNRPVNFFLGSGGIHQTFGSLDEVPGDKPDASLTASLPKAKTGNAFVVQGADGAYTKGWIQSATASTVTIVFEPLD